MSLCCIRQKKYGDATEHYRNASILPKPPKNKANMPEQDPFLQREIEKYGNPIPSRELIMALLEKQSNPLNQLKIMQHLQMDVADEDAVEAMRRRLRAMERDGQLYCNKRSRYCLVSKMDMVKGTVLAHRDGYGFLSPEQGGDDYYLSAREMQSLLHGDLVIARLADFDRKGRREAVVFKVLKDGLSTLAGRFYRHAGIGFIRADDRRIHQDVIVTNHVEMGVQEQQMVAAKLIQRPTHKQPAVAEITEIIGDQVQANTISDMAMRSHDIPFQWPETVTRQVAKLSESVAPSAKPGRVDLTHLPFVTIDGEDARDFDDAVYCEPKRRGGWRLWVAIADVTHYVTPDSALDKEAVGRGTSVYFPDQVVPMLPEILSNGLCSLKPNVERLALVCEMTISAAGNLSGYQFYEAVICSNARLTYDFVQAVLVGEAAFDAQTGHLYTPIYQLYELYKAFQQARLQRGALEFETVENRFVFDEQNQLIDIVGRSRNDAHRIIEECMICANVAAARFLRKQKLGALYRVHEGLKESKLLEFKQFLSERGIQFKGDLALEPAALAELAALIRMRPDSEMLFSMLLRTMKQAIYTPKNAGHFGLALKEYAHFTSPIRRYPDVVVHRAIKAGLAQIYEAAQQGLSKHGRTHAKAYGDDVLQQLGEQCSMTERRADDATRDVADWLKCAYMADKVGEVFEAVVCNVTGFGLFVRLEALYIDGLVHISSLQNDYYHYDPLHQCLRGERAGRVYQLGDTLEVKLVRVDQEERNLDFILNGPDNAAGRQSRRRSTSTAKATTTKSKPSKKPEKSKTTAKDKPLKKKKKKRLGKRERTQKKNKS